MLQRARCVVPFIGGCACLLASAAVLATNRELVTPETAAQSSLPFAEAPRLLELKRESLSEERGGHYWLSNQAKWGFSAESLDSDEPVSVISTANPAITNAPSSLELSQGYRLFAIHALYRPLHRREEGRSVSVSPYLGLGAGFTSPYSESAVETYRAGDEFAWNGMRGLAGVSVQLTPTVSFFGEYSVDRPTLDLRLSPKSFLDLDSPAERVQIGVSYDF